MTFLCHISTWQLHITIFMLFIEDTVLGFYHLTTPTVDGNHARDHQHVHIVFKAPLVSGSITL